MICGTKMVNTIPTTRSTDFAYENYTYTYDISNIIIPDMIRLPAVLEPRSSFVSDFVANDIVTATITQEPDIPQSTLPMINNDIFMTKVYGLVEQGFIARTKHPKKDLYLFSYTNKAENKWRWERETLQCRGLILNGSDEIISRPFWKFFTLDQIVSLKDQFNKLYNINNDSLHTKYFCGMVNWPFRCFEKMDGSFGILYEVGSYRGIASKRSFVSEQAIKGTEILNSKYETTTFDTRHYTFLFEIVYPENRIVVDYQDSEDLYLIAVIDNRTGQDVPQDKWCQFITGRVPPFAPSYYIDETDTDKHRYNLDDLKRIKQPKNQEGLVLLFDNGFRLKFKYDEYLRYHKLRYSVNEKTIWRLLKDDDTTGIKELLRDPIPTGFKEWVNNIIGDFTDIDYYLLYREADKILEQCCGSLENKTKVAAIPNDKKAFASKLLSIVGDEYGDGDYTWYNGKVNGRQLRSIVFAMNNGKDYRDMIWKYIQPEQPYRTFQGIQK